MPLGIRPTVDFAFLKTFGSPENKIALISLLNAILQLSEPIVDVVLINPFNMQDFIEDKLSVLDIKAMGPSGAIYNVEMQVSVLQDLVQRLVYYGCEIYADQLREGDPYDHLQPAYTVCLMEGLLWHDNLQVHHAFKFTDAASGKVLDNTLEIHTVELGKYNLQEAQLANATPMQWWLYWFRYADKYETEELLALFPDAAFQQASRALTEIKEKSENKLMYDSRKKAQRDRESEIQASFRDGRIQGKVEGEIKLIHTLENILLLSLTSEAELKSQTLDQLGQRVQQLQQQIKQRFSR